MKRMIILISLLVLGVSLISAAKISGAYYTPIVDNLRFRDSSHLKANIIRKLVKGETLVKVKNGKDEVINGVAGTWLQVKTSKNETGWCFDAYLGIVPGAGSKKIIEVLKIRNNVIDTSLLVGDKADQVGILFFDRKRDAGSRYCIQFDTVAKDVEADYLYRPKTFYDFELIELGNVVALSDSEYVFIVDPVFLMQGKTARICVYKPRGVIHDAIMIKNKYTSAHVDYDTMIMGYATLYGTVFENYIHVPSAKSEREAHFTRLYQYVDKKLYPVTAKREVWSPGGWGAFDVTQVMDSLIETSWGTGDMGFFYREMYRYDLKKRGLDVLIAHSPDHLAITKAGKRYKFHVKYDYDSGKLEGLFLGDKNLNVLEKNITIDKSGNFLEIFYADVKSDYSEVEMSVFYRDKNDKQRTGKWVLNVNSLPKIDLREISGK